MKKKQKDTKHPASKQARRAQPVGHWPQVIEAKREQAKIKPIELAKSAGITRVGYYYFVIGRSNPNLETVEKIADGLGERLEDLAREVRERRERE